ncbi:NADP oxidoreductase [Martelella alba]|uniref:NADP oxidoreductase n=1 Tax=Martelella alba TaxID=2590451 RepID=A0A506U6K5_9HYPH|nr:NAD(P)-binding domain-containing protein [Martelella alba]TPW29480.1 NADP oxidoreductase [Martelella alba]
MKIGIIGAGFVGRTIAKRAVAKGHEVMLSNSRGPQSLFSLPIMLGCSVGTAEEAARFGDLVIVAVPMTAIDQLPVAALEGKLVIDANNYYHERDGRISALDENRTTTSEMLAAALGHRRVVKAFNAIPMTELETDGRPDGGAERRALPLAGDAPDDKARVAALYNDFGFTPVDAGALAEGWRFERDRPAYCKRMDAATLKRVLSETRREGGIAP